MKKILLVADETGWIFDRHCKEIQSRLPQYDISIAYHKQNIPKISESFEMIYVLDPMPMNYPPKNKVIMGLRNEFLYKEHPRGPLGLYVDGFPGRSVDIKNRCVIFHVVNKNQYNIFKSVVTDKPLLIAQHGVDDKCFAWDMKYTDGQKLRIGVSGRSSRNKGFDVVKEVCNNLGLEFVSAEYGHRIKKYQMPEFYKGIDIYCCFSKTEGLNNGIMEAGAMGRPIISTMSGAAEEMIKNGVSGLLIERNKDSLKDAIIKMFDRGFRESMGRKMHEEIMNNWTWDKRIIDFRNMFDLFFERLQCH